MRTYIPMGHCEVGNIDGAPVVRVLCNCGNPDPHFSALFAVPPEVMALINLDDYRDMHGAVLVSDLMEFDDVELLPEHSDGAAVLRFGHEDDAPEGDPADDLSPDAMAHHEHIEMITDALMVTARRIADHMEAWIVGFLDPIIPERHHRRFEKLVVEKLVAEGVDDATVGEVKQRLSDERKRRKEIRAEFNRRSADFDIPKGFVAKAALNAIIIEEIMPAIYRTLAIALTSDPIGADEDVDGLERRLKAVLPDEFVDELITELQLSMRQRRARSLMSMVEIPPEILAAFAGAGFILSDDDEILH